MSAIPIPAIVLNATSAFNTSTVANSVDPDTIAPLGYG